MDMVAEGGVGIVDESEGEEEGDECYWCD